VTQSISCRSNVPVQGLIVEKWKSIRCKMDSMQRERGGTEFEEILRFTPSTHLATEIRQPKITLTATASVRNKETELQQ